MSSKIWGPATPVELVAVSILGATVAVLTLIGWLRLFRQRRRTREVHRWAFLIGLGTLTAHLVFGGMLFSLPDWVVPNHDRVGVCWFSASPIVMLFVVACGCVTWRASGKTLVLAGLGGLSLWAIVAVTVAI